jgi:hypothetical protein
MTVKGLGKGGERLSMLTHPRLNGYENSEYVKSAGVYGKKNMRAAYNSRNEVVRL